MIPTFFLASTGGGGRSCCLGRPHRVQPRFDRLLTRCSPDGVVARERWSRLGLGSPSATSGRSSLGRRPAPTRRSGNQLLCSASSRCCSSCSLSPRSSGCESALHPRAWGLLRTMRKSIRRLAGSWQEGTHLPGVARFLVRQISLYFRRGQHAHRRISDDLCEGRTRVHLQ